MKENFKENITRIKGQAREYMGLFAAQHWLKKILILAVAYLLLPNAQAVIMITIPSLITLFFINDGLQGAKRGSISFLLSSVSQIFLILMLFIIPALNEPTDVMNLFETVRFIIGFTLGGIMFLVPGYLLGLLLYDINLKKPAGKRYIMLCGALSLLLLIRNTVVILI